MDVFRRNTIFFLMLFSTLFLFNTASFSSPPAKIINNLEGMLVIRLECFVGATVLNPSAHRDQTDATDYSLVVNDKHYSLTFTGNIPTELRSGQRIKVRKGIFKTTNDGINKLIVSPKDVVITKNINVKEIPSAFGAQRTLVMLVNFQNDPNNKPWTIAQTTDAVFNTTSSMLYEFSYSQTYLQGKVVGWFTVPLSSNNSCDTLANQMPPLAEAAAAASGVDLSQFNRFVYIFPPIANCVWAGSGTVEGVPSRSWINGSIRNLVIGHELGHNLGLMHSHSLECPDSSNKGDCARVEYGDLADTMGYPFVYAAPHFNAYQKERLGWLNFTGSPPILTVTASGTYTVKALEPADGNVKALKVLKTNNSDGSQDYYYIEFRQGIGFDGPLATCTDCDFTKGVLVHQGNNKNRDSGALLDMSPTDSDKSKLVALLPGQSFSDPDASNGGITFKVESISSLGANVTVTFGGSPPNNCHNSIPNIYISPGYLTLKRGAIGTFNVWVENTSKAPCAPTHFNFASENVPQGVSLSFAPTTATVAPGVLQTVKMIATTSTSTSPGYYGLRFNAKNLENPAANAFTTGSLDVKP